MVLIVAICAQPVLLIVSWVARDSFIGMDDLDLGAAEVFLCCTGGGGGAVESVGSLFRVVGGHVGGGGRRRSSREAAREVQGREVAVTQRQAVVPEGLVRKSEE